MQTMIPKVIHYCWFGGNPLPDNAKKCIESWKRYFPDYEIKEWNESNFDVNMVPYSAEAYEAGKYAFVSDYARFWIIYNYGGIYFDTDVEVIRDLTPIICRGAYMGTERQSRNGENEVNPGLGVACEAGHHFYAEMLEMYSGMHFRNEDGTLNTKTIVDYTTAALRKYGYRTADRMEECAGICIYPPKYFCPKDYVSGRLNLTEDTYSIHHYTASWKSRSQKMFALVEKYFGYRFAHAIGTILRALHIYNS